MEIITNSSKVLASLNKEASAFPYGLLKGKYALRESLQVRERFNASSRELYDTEVIATLRHERTGDLPKYTSLGCYPLVYLDSQNNVLCASCANENDPEYWSLACADINYEDSDLDCDQCSERIESAYAEDE